ncbi:FecR family protein [Pseudomonas sp. S75]|uniref:FecR domain-containing protein n=1 Tax=unclassified Pseudomonas TaxID=196821 RepID=UPI001902F876|nr:MULTISPECIES: FecR family protein [unclassified Pseudomonas]MBJ9975138.1 FecR family protein [Pseudomonas sp. S30]MBK0152975.1 FecR family protein [Pseudomonas sp. S75]
MSGAVSDEAIIDEAAQWMAVLHSGHASAQEHQAFRQWRSTDPRRAAIFEAMGASAGTLGSDALRDMPRESLLHTINAPSGRRRFVRNVLSLVGVVSTAGLIGQLTQRWPMSGVISTGTGERLSLSLDDGSALMLDARTRVLDRFDGAQRLLQLLDGRLWIDVARDASRPFIVQTSQGRMRALGTRFLVEQGAEQTRVSMLHSQVRITTGSGSTRVIQAGERAIFDAERVLAVQPCTDGDSAWMQGMLEARNQRLEQVIDTLRSYRRGIIRVSPQAAQLRLSGRYPLDDTDRALQLLASSLPLRVDYHSPYWVSIDLRETGARMKE